MTVFLILRPSALRNRLARSRYEGCAGFAQFLAVCIFGIILLTLNACSLTGNNTGDSSSPASPPRVNGFGTAANHGHSLLALPDHVLIIATHFGLYRSTDGGQHWSGPDKTIGDLMTYSLVSSPVDPRRLYVLAEYSLSGQQGIEGVYTSADAGANWKLAARAADTGKMFTLAAGNDSANEVYSYVGNVGNAGHFLISRDGGQHFFIAGDVPLGQIQGILPIPGAAGQVLAYSNNGGIARSSDSGAHWKTLSGFDSPVFSMTTGGDKSPIYADSDAGIYVSKDAGKSFQLVYSKSSYSALTAVPGEAETVYGKTGRSIYKSTDGGRTWQALPQIKGNLENLAADPTNPARLFLSLSYPMEVYEFDPKTASWISLTPKA